MTEPVFQFDDNDSSMRAAYAAAQKSFRFFWRELSWERRRIVPALDMAMIKLPFTDGPRSDGNPEYEQMWIDQIEFDGITLSGSLLNAPNRLTSVKKGDTVRVPFSRMTDWMMTADGKAYGGHTVNLMRSRMNTRERDDHDKAWGLDFGDPDEIKIELTSASEPKRGLFSKVFGSKARTAAPAGTEGAFTDHPMCVNILPKYEAQIRESPDIAAQVDERGWTLLHGESLAGNLGVVKLLVRHGADIGAKTPDGRTAATLAQNIGWDNIAAFLLNDARFEQS